ncbi:excinuclease ATPase [Cupriavidus sp. 30B13]|uniref:excinuclease ATPase n=1 Tax=Cupriavidus sp. 30B13 TaxID=3384241 RepID=UPI003B90A2A9
MKPWMRFSLMAGALLAGTGAQAADQLLNQPIDKALASAEARSRVDPSIRLLFGFNRLPDAQGGQSYKTVKRIRRPVDNSSATGGAPPPGDEELCATTFVQAVQELQQRAMKEGGNAVVDIRSNWKNDETASDSTYVCAKGAAYIGVALKGVVVRTGS